MDARNIKSLRRDRRFYFLRLSKREPDGNQHNPYYVDYRKRYSRSRLERVVASSVLCPAQRTSPLDTTDGLQSRPAKVVKLTRNCGGQQFAPPLLPLEIIPFSETVQRKSWATAFFAEKWDAILPKLAVSPHAECERWATSYLQNIPQEPGSWFPKNFGAARFLDGVSALQASDRSQARPTADTTKPGAGTSGRVISL